MQNKNFLKKRLPTPEAIRNHRSLSIFGSLLDRPSLWRIHRRNVAKGAAIGMLWSWIPLPMHTIPAVLTAIMFHANLPFTIVFMWLVNPITMVPCYYFAYRLGLKLLHLTPLPFAIELSWQWMSESLPYIWKPLLLGCGICGVGAALLVYSAIRFGWRYRIIRRLKQRQVARQKATISP